MPNTILVVDDDPVQRRLMEAALSRAGHKVLLASDGAQALAVVDDSTGRSIGAVVLDLMMPGVTGLQVLDEFRERDIAVPVIVQTAQGGIDTVVAAMRRGAFDFVVKPVSPERLQAAVASALKVEALGVAARAKPAKVSASGGFRDLIAASPGMEKVVRLGRRAAASGIPVLLEGETGVGKEMVARAIQAASDRKGKPFVTVNCGAIPANLVESILFGHEKGSFTGATEKHVGKFVEANGGTLFLDEVGELPLDAQVKLLRAIQEGEVDPVGGRSTIKVDIRLISATNRDLIQRVKQGQFREDLFYRLNVFPIFIPPLRERRADVALMAQHFVGRLGKSETGGRVKGVSASALSLLEAYDWPGNIRQLENAIFRAVVLCEGEILTDDDFPHIRAQVSGISADEMLRETAGPSQTEPLAPVIPTPQDQLGRAFPALDEKGQVRSLADVEADMIRLAIDHYAGQMSEVARRLGIGRSTLYRKLKELGIEVEDDRSQRLAS